MFASCQCVALSVLLLASTAIAAPRTDKHGDPLPDAAIARFGTTRLSHPTSIAALVWSADGKLIASASDHRHRSIRMWNAATGQLVRTLAEGSHLTSGLAFSPDGKVLAGSSDGRAIMWEVETGKEIASMDSITAEERAEYERVRGFGGGFERRPASYSVCFSMDGKTLAHATSHRAMLWDVESRKLRATLKSSKEFVHFLAFTPDGKYLLGAGIGRAFQLWNPETGALIREFEVEGPEREANIFGLAIAPDSKHAALKLKDHLVVIEIETGKVVWREKMPGDHDEPVMFSRDSLLAFGGRNGVRIYDWKANKLLAQITEGEGNLYLRRVCYAPDGKHLAWSGSDGVIRIWDIAASKEIMPPPGNRGWIDQFALRPDGRQLATVDLHRNLRVWDTAKQEVIQTHAIDRKLYPYCSVFPQDGGVVVVGDSRSHVAAIDWKQSKTTIATGPQVDRYVGSLSPDGQTALATDPWSVVSHLVFDRGAKWVKFTGDNLKSYDSRFSADSKFIWVSGWDYLAYVDVANAKELWRVDGYANPNFVRGSLACSADGRLVAAGITSLSAEPRESVIRIWETGRGHEWKTMKSPHAVVTAAAFSRDNRLLVTASNAYDSGWPRRDANENIAPVISLWEVATGLELARFTGHDSTVRALAFAPDSRTFYSSSNDGTVLQWDWLGLAHAQPPAVNDQTWSDLSNRDGTKIYRAMQRLAALQKDCVALFGERLKPPMAVAPETIARLLRELDSDNFKTRDAATRELDALGEQVIAALEGALQRSPTPEAEKRILTLLKERGGKPYPTDELQRARAVLVLERIGGPDAKKLLVTMAASKADVLSVRQSREALDRNP